MIPESSRWLISQGKYDDAENIIQRIAKVNKKKIPSRIIDEKTLETPKAANVYHLFSTFTMTKRTLIILSKLDELSVPDLILKLDSFPPFLY